MPRQGTAVLHGRNHLAIHTMRKIKAKERERAGNIYCAFCRPNRVHAVWRRDGGIDAQSGVACEEHKDKLAAKDDERMTEADYQTWWRL